MKRLTALLLIASAFVAGASWSRLAANQGRRAAPAEARPVAPRSDLTGEEAATIELFERVSPSVVFITSLTTVRRSRFSLDTLQVPRGTGSGFVWDEYGHVVTNAHVLEGAQAAQVTLADRSTWDAELVGAASEKDLAVLRIQAPPERLPPVVIGSSSDLRVGQGVYAIGNPFGLDQTLTSGLISALGREIESPSRVPIRDVIQTDAAINPGNSGGPLLDSSGRLIGVNAAIYSPSGASAGIGFAIPIDTVNWVVPELINYGRLQRPSLGVALATLRGEAGVLVIRVFRGSGAEAAGVRPTERDRFGRTVLGDLIVAVDGEPVGTPEDIVLLLEKRRPGDRVVLSVVRGRETLDLRVRLDPPSN